MTMVKCLCGKEAPVEVITDSEKDEEVKGWYLGKKVVICRECHTITEVTEKLQKLLDDSEQIGQLSGCPAPMVSLADEEKEPTEVTFHSKK